MVECWFSRPTLKLIQEALLQIQPKEPKMPKQPSVPPPESVLKKRKQASLRFKFMEFLTDSV